VSVVGGAECSGELALVEFQDREAVCGRFGGGVAGGGGASELLFGHGATLEALP
jgi:hypothetical protein